MDTKSSDNCDRNCEEFLEEILYAQSIGISVSVDGELYSVEDIARLRQVMENHDYMKSYVSDGHGRVTHIDFDQIIGI